MRQDIGNFYVFMTKNKISVFILLQQNGAVQNFYTEHQDPCGTPSPSNFTVNLDKIICCT